MFYEHHGIYVGNGRVVHYAGLCNGWQSGPVEEVSLGQFANGERVFVFRHRSPHYSNAEIVMRARSRLGEKMYHVLRNNCEHFCEWCITGQRRSRQVHKWMSLASRMLRTVVRWGAVAWEAAAQAVRLRSSSAFLPVRNDRPLAAPVIARFPVPLGIEAFRRKVDKAAFPGSPRRTR